MPAQQLQLCLTLCDPTDCSPPGSFVYGILQARILPFPSPGYLPDSGIKPMSPALQVDSTSTEPFGIACICVCCCFSRFWGLFVTPQSIVWGLSVHGIVQARMLEWTAISFSRAYAVLKLRLMRSFQITVQTLNSMTSVLIKKEKTGKNTQKAMWSQRQKLESSCYEWTNTWRH